MEPRSCSPVLVLVSHYVTVRPTADAIPWMSWSDPGRPPHLRQLALLPQRTLLLPTDLSTDAEPLPGKSTNGAISSRSWKTWTRRCARNPPLSEVSRNSGPKRCSGMIRTSPAAQLKGCWVSVVS